MRGVEEKSLWNYRVGGKERHMAGWFAGTKVGGCGGGKPRTNYRGPNREPQIATELIEH